MATSEPNSELTRQVEAIRREIDQIKQRNSKVEQDKAWEISLTRRTFLTALTYAVTSIVFLSIDVNQPLLAALIPTTGYVLSTLSLPLVKKAWLTRLDTANER